MTRTVAESASSAASRRGQAVTPLHGYERLRSTDVDEVRGYVSSIFCPHLLEPLTGAGRVDARVNHAPLGSTSLNYLRYGVPMVVEPGQLGAFFLVQIQLSGGVDVRCGAQRATLGPGQASVLSPTEHARMAWSEDAAELIVRFERATMERALAGLLGRELTRPLVFDVAMDLRRGQPAAWWRTVRHIQQELELSNSLLCCEPVVAQFEQTLICSLLHCQPHNYSSVLHHGHDVAIPRHVKRVEDYIDAHPEQAHSIPDLAAVAGVSARTLFNGFQCFRGTTPIRYLRRVRLQRVRAELQRGEPRATVTAIALKWGFTQLGRFAAEYRQSYGESPSTTLKRRRDHLN